MKVRFKKMDPRASVPEYANAGDAGADLRAMWTSKLNAVGYYGSRQCFDTGIAIEIPDGHVGLVLPRSGLARKHGVVAAVGVIDSGFRGAIGVTLINSNEKQHQVDVGDKIAQLVVVPVARCEFVEADELSETERGKSGFGSSGR